MAKKFELSETQFERTVRDKIACKNNTKFGTVRKKSENLLGRILPNLTTLSSTNLIKGVVTGPTERGRPRLRPKPFIVNGFLDVRVENHSLHIRMIQQSPKRFRCLRWYQNVYRRIDRTHSTKEPLSVTFWYQKINTNLREKVVTAQVGVFLQEP